MSATPRATATAISSRIGRETDGIAATDRSIRVKPGLKMGCSTQYRHT